MIYKYDIPVGFPPGITSPREDCRSWATPSSDTPREVIPGGNPTGMSYLFYYTKQNSKHKREKNYKHQRCWINTRCLPC